MKNMWHSLCNLLSRVWSNLVSSLGSTTLSIVLFSITIPIIIFIISFFFNYYEHKKEGVEIIQLIKESLFAWKFIITSAIYILAWIALFGWFFTITIYNDHKSLKEQFTKSISERDQEIKNLKEQLSKVKSIEEEKRKKKEISIKLADFLSEAVVLQNQCWRVTTLPQGKTTFQLYDVWHKKVANYINEKVGYDESKLFIDSLSLQVPQPTGLSEIDTKVWILTEQSKVRLRDLIGRLR
jgi:hypothetical protein